MSASPSPTVSTFMTHHVFALAPDTSLEVAGRLLYAKHITGAPVIDAAGNPIGVVTAKDLVDPDRPRGAERGTATVYRLSAGGRETLPGGAISTPGRVHDVMTRFVIAVGPDTALEHAMELMTSDNIHRLLVVDGRKQIIGIVSSMDLIRALLQQRRP
jgi:CBS domain-containing protein